MTLTPGVGMAISFRPSERRMLAGVVAHPVPAPDFPPDIPAIEQAVVDATNRHRASVGLSHLQTSPRLHGATGSAGFYARYMAEFLFMTHDTPAKPGYSAMTWYDRIYSFGTPMSCALGENIAFNTRAINGSEADGVIHAWLGDEGHKQNLESPAWTSIGVGVAAVKAGVVAADGSDFTGLLFFCQDFSNEAGGQPVPPDPPPVERPINVGSKWKRTSTGVVGTVTAVTPTTVTWKGKGLPVSRAKTKFRAQFTWVSG